eukprot:scaffold77453_cov72-Phaeocystis_antarctica.AAC.3
MAAHPRPLRCLLARRLSARRNRRPWSVLWRRCRRAEAGRPRSCASSSGFCAGPLVTSTRAIAGDCGGDRCGGAAGGKHRVAGGAARTAPATSSPGLSAVVPGVAPRKPGGQPDDGAALLVQPARARARRTARAPCPGGTRGRGAGGLPRVSPAGHAPRSEHAAARPGGPAAEAAGGAGRQDDARVRLATAAHHAATRRRGARPAAHRTAPHRPGCPAPRTQVLPPTRTAGRPTLAACLRCAHGGCSRWARCSRATRPPHASAPTSTLRAWWRSSRTDPAQRAGRARSPPRCSPSLRARPRQPTRWPQMPHSTAEPRSVRVSLRLLSLSLWRLGAPGSFYGQVVSSATEWSVNLHLSSPFHDFLPVQTHIFLPQVLRPVWPRSQAQTSTNRAGTSRGPERARRWAVPTVSGVNSLLRPHQARWTAQTTPCLGAQHPPHLFQGWGWGGGK